MSGCTSQATGAHTLGPLRATLMTLLFHFPVSTAFFDSLILDFGHISGKPGGTLIG